MVEKCKKNRKYLNIPSSGNQIRAVELSTLTEHQEVVKTGNYSKRQLRMPSKFSSMIRFKKLQIKVEALGNWWTGSSVVATTRHKVQQSHKQ